MAPFKKTYEKPIDKPKPSAQKNNIKHVADAWILVSSKSGKCPGRPYYFNTLTGESVWNLSEASLSVGSMHEKKAKKGIVPTNAVDNQLNEVITCKDDNVHVNNTTPEVVHQPVIPPNAMYWPNSNYHLYAAMPPMISPNVLPNQITSNIMPPVFSPNGLSNQITPDIPPFMIPPSVYPQVFQPSPFQPQTIVRNPEILSISQRFKGLQKSKLNKGQNDDAVKIMPQYAPNDLRIKLFKKKMNKNILPKTETPPPMEPEPESEPEELNQLDNEIDETQERFEEYVDEDGEQYANESNYFQSFHREVVSYSALTNNDGIDLHSVDDVQREVEEGIDECSDDTSSDDQIIVLDLTPVYKKYGINTDKACYIFADTNVFMNNLNFLVMYVNSGNYFRLVLSRHVLNELQMIATNVRESQPNDIQAARGFNHLTNNIRAGIAIFVEDLMLNIVKYEIGCPAGDDFMLTACLWLKKSGEQYKFITNDKVLITKTKTSKLNVVHIDEIKNCIKNQIIQVGSDTFLKREDICITTTIEQTRNPTKHIKIDNTSNNSEKTIKFADIEEQQHQQPTIVTRKTRSEDTIVPEPPKKVLCQPQVSIQNPMQVPNCEPEVNITPTNQQPANKPVETAVWGFTSQNKSKITRKFKKNTRAMKILNKVELITSSPRPVKDDNNDVFMFEITDEMMETNLKTRCEEWVSHYDQIMVDVLSQILQRNPETAKNIKPPPPWTITEATNCIKSMFCFDSEISRAANAFINLLMKHSDMRGMINKELTPEEFMKIFSYGVYLLDTMESVLPDIDDIEVAQRSLSQLLNNIKDGSDSSQVVDIDSIVTSNATANHESNKQSSDAESVKNKSRVILPDAGTQKESNDKSTVKIVRKVNLDFDFNKYINNKSGNKFTKKNATKDSSNQMSDNNRENTEESNKPATDAGVKAGPTILRKFIVFPKLEEKLCEQSVIDEDTSASDMHDDNVYPGTMYPELDYNDRYYDDTVNNDGNYTHFSDGDSGQRENYDDDVHTDVDDTYTDCYNTDTVDGETYCDDGEYLQDYPETINTESQVKTEQPQSVIRESHSELSNGNKNTPPKSENGDGPKDITKDLLRGIKNVFTDIHSFCTQVQQSDNSLSSDPKKLEIKKQTEASECLLKRLMENFDSILERENERAVKNASNNKKYRETIQKCKMQGSILLEALGYIASEIK